MTQEGSTFYNAMEKGAGTLQGKITNLEGVWKTFQATWAETSGLGQLWKNVIDGVTRAIVKQTEVLTDNARAQELFDKKKAAGLSVYDEYEYALLQIKILNRELSQNDFASEELKYFKLELEYYNAFIESNKELIELHNQRIEKENETLEVLSKSKSEYEDLQKQIEEAYAKTTEGQKEAIENEIELWQKRLKALERVKGKQ
jgi:hypothetical protein